MTARTVSYWIATVVFCAAMAAGGVLDLLRVDFLVEGMDKLGYPVYILTILGVAKLLGVVALLPPGIPLLKEWAYAGFAFELLGATVSHLYVGDPVNEVAPPLVLLALAAASYLLRPPSRRLASATAGASTGPAPADGRESGPRHVP